MIRALIIDDHEIVRRGLKQVFGDEFSELEIGEAENSRAALELITTQDWDIVLLDINIPGRNGLEALGEIKRLRPRTPVLVVSAYPEEEFAIRSFKLGASGYLSKSNAADEVAVAARKVMAGGRYVTAWLAEKLAAALGGDLQQAPHHSLSSRELVALAVVARERTTREPAPDRAWIEKRLAFYRAR